MVVTAKGEVQTNEEAQENVHVLNLFVTVQLLEDTPGTETKSQKKERKPTLRGKWESVFSGRHMDSVPKEAHAVSVMTKQPLATVAVVRDEKDHRLLPHQIRRQRLTVKKATETKAPTKEVDKKCTMKHETNEWLLMSTRRQTVHMSLISANTCALMMCPAHATREKMCVCVTRTRCVVFSTRRVHDIR